MKPTHPSKRIIDNKLISIFVSSGLVIFSLFYNDLLGIKILLIAIIILMITNILDEKNG